jgi:aspartate/methionine/tyrosine aminotransferase
MLELMREVGFLISVMPQGASYAFADASKWTDDPYLFAFELREEAGVGVAPGVDFGQDGKRAPGESLLVAGAVGKASDCLHELPGPT